MYRVVIADDEPKVSMLIKTLIDWEKLGLELVGIANDGISALEIIETVKPHIVITDIRMPGYDGIELIERAKALDAQIDFIIISGYRHFEYAQKAIKFGVEDYLLKPLKAAEINATLAKMTEQYSVRDAEKQYKEQTQLRFDLDAKKLSDQFFQKILKMGVEGDLFIDTSLLQEYHFETISGETMAFVVKPDLCGSIENKSLNKLLMEKCEKSILMHLNSCCVNKMVYQSDFKTYVIVNYDESDKKKIRKALLGIIDEIQSLNDLFERIKMTIGVGTTHLAEALPKGFIEAERACENRLVAGPGKIIDFMPYMNPNFIENKGLTFDLRKQMMTAIEILDEEKVAEAIGEVKKRTLHTEDICGFLILETIEACIQAFNFGMKNQYGIDEWMNESQRLFREKLKMCNRGHEAFDGLIQYVKENIEHITRVKKSENNKPIRDVQKYIQMNFASNITLEYVSQMVGFNATYFSSLFKKETGINFLEFLTEVRVNEAKRLLADSKKSVADVAYEVGYSDVKHFSKVFSKVAGIHPSKYRKLYY